ncbi:DMT transporter permease [Alsobacter metallidurans]|uniref:DMT transporter permease n=1 Tax=Alsobacter metallidurans TaxID=340221 RepID=A0A917MJI9_9HYPH|nr:DMT family transporter [Alsobacter metallidurans]GGH31530.1 DMT transporter permease [Alsobacter metallidurans]
MSPPPIVSDAVDARSLGVAAFPVAPARAPAASGDNVALGIAYIVGSTVFFSAGDIAAKMLTATIPAVEIAWMRYVVLCALVLPAVFWMGGAKRLATTRMQFHILRGLGMVISSLVFMVALAHMPVAEATAINFVSPIFITALSIPLLGEKVGMRRWIAAAVGLTGVIIVVQPGGASFQLAALLPAASAAIWAFTAILTRLMSDERPEATLAWSGIVGLVTLSMALPFAWVTPTGAEIGYALLMGVGSTVGHWLLVLGYRRAGASLLAPFTYVQLLWASAFGFLVFGALPGASTLLGGAVIAASGLYTAHRERVRARMARA